METVAMEEAVQVALNLTNQDETLVVVTADHSHVFMMGGYPSRGNSILGNVSVRLSVYGNTRAPAC